MNQLFALRGKRWHLLNAAHITLLPKADDATKVKDFRPISLMHSVEKILFKLLANRLAPIPKQLIPCSQSAFIKSRSIQDNFLFVKNAVQLLHKSKQPSLLLKLDIAGAFDCISWSYLLELMQHLGFGHHWCDIISILWSSASSRIWLMGSLASHSKLRKGLHQGDPLSAMLFTIAIAPLHWLFAKACSVHALSPLRLPPSQLSVNLYADHAAMFISS